MHVHVGEVMDWLLSWNARYESLTPVAGSSDGSATSCWIATTFREPQPSFNPMATGCTGKDVAQATIATRLL